MVFNLVHNSAELPVFLICSYKAGSMVNINFAFVFASSAGLISKLAGGLIYLSIPSKSSSLQSDTNREITVTFLANEREAQLKRENISVDVIKEITTPLKDITSAPTPAQEPEKRKTEYEIKITTTSQIKSDDSFKDEFRLIQKTTDVKKAEVNEEQVKNVIDEIIQKGTIVAATRSPIIEKDISTITRDIIESEKRSYDVKAVGREERRHSSISPAISLERIAESDVESEEDISKFPSESGLTVTKFDENKGIQIKKSDSAMKQMADNIEIIIKQASEDVDLSGEETVETQEPNEKVSVDSIIEQAITTVEKHLETDKDKVSEESKGIVSYESKTVIKERPLLIKSLSRDSGETVILPKKKQPRTFSVQSSPEEVEEQIYTDSESDMDKAKVLEIIEPVSDIEGKLEESSFDTRKIRTDSLDDADDLFPERETEYFVDDTQYVPETSFVEKSSKTFTQETTLIDIGSSTPEPGVAKIAKKSFIDKITSSDVISKSTTESSVTTVISTLTKSSEEDQKSVLDEATSADFSKISGADLLKDSSKASIEMKEISKIEEGVVDDRGTPDISKKSIDLTKDYSKSSIDSKDTSRDFTTNELSKDSTIDLTKEFSKASVESVKDASKSFDEKTYSEDQSSLDISKTLASDASEALNVSKDYVETIDSDSKILKVSDTSSVETSVLAESKVITTDDEQLKTTGVEVKATKSDFYKGTPKKDFEGTVEGPSKSITIKDDVSQMKETYLIEKYEEIEKETKKTEEEKTVKTDIRLVKDEASKSEKRDEEPSDISELNRRCSTLLEDISQGALIRIDSSHVAHDLSLKFSKTPPPSPVDLTVRDRSKIDDAVGDKPAGLQPRGSDSSFLDANRQSPRASSAGDSLISETEAHQSGILREASKVLTAAATPKSPTRHLADNMTFINVSQPTITSGAIDLVDSTIEKSIDVIDQIKRKFAVKMEAKEKKLSTEPAATLDSKFFISMQPVQKSFGDFKEAELKFQTIDPDAVVSNMIAKLGTTEEFSTIMSHKETETRKISGQEYFSETKQVSSSDDDSLIIKTEITHELRGQEHELKEKTFLLKDGAQTEKSQKVIEKAQEASTKRSDIETKTLFKSTDDTSIINVQREFLEQGLYSGRQTKSEEKMTALKDDTVKKKHEVKYSERDLSHEQWGKEYFTEPCELEDIEEIDDSKSKTAFIDSTLKIVEKDESLSNLEISEKGKIVSSKTEHHKEESIIESKEHDDLSFDVSHEASFKSETVDKHGSTETSPKSKSKSFKKDNEVYEVNFIKEIKVSTSPVKSTFSRTGSQETHSESEAVPELPHDDKPCKDKDTGIEVGKLKQKEKLTKSPVKIPQQQVEDLVWEISLEKMDSFEMQEESFKTMKPVALDEKVFSAKGSEIDSTHDFKHDMSMKLVKSDYSPGTVEISDDLSTISKDIMIKSAESMDTECMVKSLESHEGEVLQKSIDSTMSAETLQPSEFSTEADSAFLTGTDHKKDDLKLTKEKSLEDICSSGYDTDLSSAEFHATKFETERVDYDSFISAQPLADLSVLEKTIDEVKQSLEAAQVEILSEKSDGSSKYKQSPSEFQFKLLISPERPEVITEEPHPTEDLHDIKKFDAKQKSDLTISDGISQVTSSQEETSYSEEDKDTIHQKESSPGPADVSELSCRSDSGPHSILETESELIMSEKDSSSKDSPEVKLRAQKHIKSKLGVVERRSASDLEGWSSSGGSSHYQSFEHSESRPLSSDMEGMMTAQSGTDFDTALTTQDISSRSLRTSRDYYTATSSLASRDSMKSLDSDGSSHLASIDISDASETLVPSANELKEELMESSTYVTQFLHEGEKEIIPKIKDVSSDDEIFEDEKKISEVQEMVGKMKRSHEMRFQPKDMIPEQFPLESLSESTDTAHDTPIQKFDRPLSIEIEREVKTSLLIKTPKEEVVEETITGVTKVDDQAIPFKVTKLPKTQREFVDIESQIIPVGSFEYEQIVKSGKSSPQPIKTDTEEAFTMKSIHKLDEIKPTLTAEVEQECVKKIVEDIAVVPFPITKLSPSQREFVDVDSDIIPVGSKQYEEILKSKSDSSVPKTKAEKSVTKVSDSLLADSKQSSSSSLKTHEHLSTPQTPLSAPSQSSISTENGREYVLDDMYDIPETPELRSEIATEGTSSRSELIVTTEEKTLHQHDKEQDSPTSDEFEIVDKPNEMDDFVVIEEVAKEAQETDTEGKSIQIAQQKYVRRHDTEVEAYLTMASKKQESEYSTSGSLSDEEMLQYELEQKRLKAQELAEIEAGKKWIQMQFEGDPRYEYERVPLEDIKEEEMTDFDASRIGSLSSQKESIGSYGSFRNSYGSLSESEMASRLRFRVRGENDDISISSLQEFENLEKALMEQYQQHSSSSQDSLNGSLPRRYFLSKSSQGDDVSISSLKEFEGLESACIEALKAEIAAKQKEALLLSDPKILAGGFLEHERRSYSGGSSESSPPQKGGSPSQKTGSPSQKSGSPLQKIGSYGSPSQKMLTDSVAIRKIIDQQIVMDQKPSTIIVTPTVVTVKKYDDRGSFFVEEEVDTSTTKPVEITETCKKASAFICAAAPSDGSAESLPGDCEEMMKFLEEEAQKKKPKPVVTRTFTDGGVIEVVRTTTVIQQRFVDGKKVSETVTSTEGDKGVDIPGTRRKDLDSDVIKSFGSEISTSQTSQQSDMDSLITVLDKSHDLDSSVTITRQTILLSSEKPEDLDFSRSETTFRELSPSSGRSVTHSIVSVSGKHFTDPASGSWSGQDEDLSSSGSLSRGARADLMLGSTDSLEATSSNATRATYNYEVDTPMTGSLTSGGSNTMVSSLDTLDPITAVHMESLEHPSTSEHFTHDYEVHEPDSDPERLELDGKAPRAKERTIMFDSTDTLSAVSGDSSVKEGAVETPAPTFYIGDTPIVRALISEGERREEMQDAEGQVLSGSCPASLPPTTHSSPPVPAQRSFTVRGRTTHWVLTARDLPCGGFRRSPRHRQSLEHQNGLGPFYYPDREWSGAREMTYKTRFETIEPAPRWPSGGEGRCFVPSDRVGARRYRLRTTRVGRLTTNAEIKFMNKACVPYSVKGLGYVEKDRYGRHAGTRHLYLYSRSCADGSLCKYALCAGHPRRCSHVTTAVMRPRSQEFRGSVSSTKSTNSLNSGSLPWPVVYRRCWSVTKYSRTQRDKKTCADCGTTACDRFRRSPRMRPVSILVLELPAGNDLATSSVGWHSRNVAYKAHLTLCTINSHAPPLKETPGGTKHHCMVCVDASRAVASIAVLHSSTSAPRMLVPLLHQISLGTPRLAIMRRKETGVAWRTKHGTHDLKTVRTAFRSRSIHRCRRTSLALISKPPWCRRSWVASTYRRQCGRSLSIIGGTLLWPTSILEFSHRRRSYCRLTGSGGGFLAMRGNRLAALAAFLQSTLPELLLSRALQLARESVPPTAHNFGGVGVSLALIFLSIRVRVVILLQFGLVTTY
ncbi:hypothetical protein EVAR_24051_1 [Eumeta japonica]|uniref:Uncharacterized protein n=1 Tax=Eumeta variegata TaxID=151549 RepID=A0A4C1VSM3_EUMVA|nr:hypothetical protein EVAR_24051_1 [Eumeta japonica]